MMVAASAVLLSGIQLVSWSAPSLMAAGERELCKDRTLTRIERDCFTRHITIMPSAASNSTEASESEMLERNRHFYDSLWSDGRLIEPERFNTWPFVSSLLAKQPRRLEIAPGLRPRLPIAATQFVDISEPALTVLERRGGKTTFASITNLPFGDQSFDLICALDVIEHVEDDLAAMAELGRLAADESILLLSTELHQEFWTPFDDFVGHRRRYEPERLLAMLAEHGFAVEQSAVFGMKPKSSRLVDIGMWFLRHRRQKAMRWYNRVLPWTVRFQKPLKLRPGFVCDDQTAEIFLVCRRTRRS
jgi:SAM-dependent methyltransferase